MTATPSSRLEGLTTSVAEKAPVRCATTAAITLENEQTIDGVACVEGDRILVKDQADPIENGIYNVIANAAWERSKDFNGTLDCVGGTWVRVVSGTINELTGWYVIGNRQLIPGIDDITWAVWPNNTPNVGSTLPYLIHTQFLGTPGSNVTVGGHVFGDTTIGLVANWTNKVWFRTSTPPSASLVLTVYYPSTSVASIGTATISTAGVLASATVSAINSTTNGLLKLTSPTTTSVVDIFMTLQGRIS
jgi:hypothetical protein